MNWAREQWLQRLSGQLSWTWSRTRSAGFALESGLLSVMSRVIPGAVIPGPPPDPALSRRVRRELFDLLRADSDRIAQGVYPITVLVPEHPMQHLKRIPRLALDGVRIASRRRRGRTTEFNRAAKRLLDSLPRYYRRTFHFQTDGYLSEHSADLYEHQVEILFVGAADAMRRLVIAPLRERFGPSDGEGLHFLEVGAGTGRTARFVKLAFPRARITVVDLSDPYLKAAQNRLAGFDGIDFVRANASELPFRDGAFDAAYSVFLYHELPETERHNVVRESVRVVKPDGGWVGLVDSMQLGEVPELDPLLERFPESFHEPYYRNYLEVPMERILESEGLSDIGSGRGFFSKVCWGTRAPRATGGDH